ncbi:hypothetical protein ACETK8_03420 [Brevundimonas staleyi]|uniref:PH domain-containing protein n=1 Tax=Brevundimonas staleyi TaxID=74326 RepID=A0ABW0FTI4_9CAUL
MSDTEAEPRLVFTGAAWKSGLRTLLSIGIVVGCILWISSGIEGAGRYPSELVQFVVWSCLVGSGVMALFSFIRILAPPQLILTAEGFLVRGFRKPRLVRWADVLKFELFEQRGGSMVGYILSQGTGQVRDGAFTRAMMPGLDGVIAVFPDETPFEVMQVMVAWHRQYGAEGARLSSAE